MNFRLLPILIMSFLGLLIIKVGDVAIAEYKNSKNNKEVFLGSKIAQASTVVPVAEANVAQPAVTDSASSDKLTPATKKPLEKRWQRFEDVVNNKNRNVSNTKPKSNFEQGSGGVCSDVNIDLLRTLSARREQLNNWEKDIVNKKNVLMATSDQLDKKLLELKTLKLELAELIGQYDDATKAKIDNLVKIYEAMKPQEAAKIFNHLDMDVLLKVFGQMKQSKVAGIMANLNPEKARDITNSYALKKNIPILK